jgi:hypothetical protein
MSTYTFRRTHHGVTSFARVTITRIENTDWRVQWGEGTKNLRAIYGSAEAALRTAADVCRAAGGNPSAVRIDEIVEVVSDTKPDAVECAAVMAAWKEWNCDENRITIDLNSIGRLEVRFDGRG